MKDIFRNPIFYYISIPAVVALWPLLVFGLYMPAAEKQWTEEKAQFIKAGKIMNEILSLDGERLDFRALKDNNNEFDYAVAIDKGPKFFDGLSIVVMK